jgi:hypothetical protein
VPNNFFPHRLYVLPGSLISPPSSSKGRLRSDARMQKQAVKIRIPDHDPRASDGYYVFVSLLFAVGFITSTIVLAFAIEMLR